MRPRRGSVFFFGFFRDLFIIVLSYDSDFDSDVDVDVDSNISIFFISLVVLSSNVSGSTVVFRSRFVFGRSVLFELFKLLFLKMVSRAVKSPPPVAISAVVKNNSW